MGEVNRLCGRPVRRAGLVSWSRGLLWIRTKFSDPGFQVNLEIAILLKGAALDIVGGPVQSDRSDIRIQRQQHDEKLRDEGVDRIYDVYLPQEGFSILENHLRSNIFPNLDRKISIREFTAELGRANSEEAKKDNGGIAAMAYECGIPIYCPGIQDSMLGLQA